LKILHDKQQYDKVWEVLIQNVESLESLQQLASQTEKLVRLQSGGNVQGRRNVPRQYNRERDALILTSKSCSARNSINVKIPVQLDLERPVKSLDQLYVQASCMHPILLGKVKSWALASNGMFQVEGSHEYRLLEASGKSSNDGICSLKFAKLKSTGRAIEKVVRSYGQARLYFTQ
jgi:hypothetical protein